MLKRAKQSLLLASKVVGLQARVRRSEWRARRLVVLAYHGIAVDDEHHWNPALYMAQATFRRRLELLRDGGYAVLPLGEAVERLYRGDLPPRSVSITFDDGAADFYTRAFPVLREFGFPSTVYLTTYYCRYNRPVFDVALPYILWKGRAVGRLSRAVIGGAGEWPIGDASERAAAVAEIRAHAAERGFDGAPKDALLETVATELGVDYEAMCARRILHLMSEPEVAHVAKHGVSIQLHTHRHRTPRDLAAFTDEIEENRKHIAALTEGRPEGWHFCYPDGRHEPELGPWLRDLAVRSATTCEPGIASPSSEPILLPRVVDSEYVSDIEFEGWLSGVSAFLPRRATGSDPAAE